jgi:hypothetical protein
MGMKYKIGNFVRHERYADDTFFVVATKQQPLTPEYLESRGKPLMVKGVNEMARARIYVDSDVRKGFDYIVRRILPTMENGCYLLDETDIPCFEEDIY